ncbi:putative membrane protein, putative [Trypanosoma equiperdum]|uniref:Transmembrane protein n=4 Tax=Trypanozoon TaxID=39700 RepID=Q585H9_TRYB2|nr:hypothetical protein, conserved [Trypanosoma brucei gambiense DAL972]XP_844521.1 hypothetical protein, conserved [Trypanosoma brucei brucei TREU927]AAX79226.1 hypothetical protein, conserved [Trypanosoma brucei]RHW72870.1 putative membrane protein [Trypanosoma brucei equiperdum]SCU72310.1 Predicted membrane protein, putative [Trypanosoma equiperdum]AAZ10962.1 hypothetical protein, conserved [Trypanosoma brucei brucei TREU927]CBH10667.1 hypothetical protein, conserved [Trypanosoma brucei ga|eukprot:XP_011772955.1 hypothetical protein, conserved [Trypanosoma brucei gambiense DAL972]
MRVNRTQPTCLSLLFQVLLYCTCSWCVFWFVTTLSLLIFKGATLYFPPTALFMEIISVFLLLVLGISTLALGKRGNLLEEVGSTSLTVFLLLVGIGGAVYYMWLQTYVMMLDFIVSLVMLVLDTLTALCGACTAFGLFRSRRSKWNGILLVGKAPPIAVVVDIKHGKGD